jgi:glycosyltransferase involved in cell wall biosynthesis
MCATVALVINRTRRTFSGQHKSVLPKSLKLQEPSIDSVPGVRILSRPLILRHRARFHDHWRKRRAAVRPLSFRPSPRSPAPAEQLLRRQTVTARNPGYRHAALIALGDDLRLPFGAPRTTAACPAEHFQPANRLRLRFRQRLSIRHRCNPARFNGWTLAHQRPPKNVGPKDRLRLKWQWARGSRPSYRAGKRASRNRVFTAGGRNTAGSISIRRVGLRPERRNHLWSYDFVEAQTHDGRKVRPGLEPRIATVLWNSAKPLIASHMSISLGRNRHSVFKTDSCIPAAGAAVSEARYSSAMNVSGKAQVSIIVPCFNAAETIERALDSLKCQTFSDYEIIVVDDASTDRSVELVEKSRIPGLHLIRHAINRGAAASRNTGIRAARHRWIAFLDSDDAWKPEKLARQFDALRLADQNTRACTTGFILHKNGLTASIRVPLRPYLFKKEIWFGCTISPGSTLMVDQDIFDRIGLFDETLRRLEDWDWLLRFAAKYDMLLVPDPLVDVYLRPRTPEQTAEQAQSVVEALNYIETKHLPRISSSLQRRQLRSSLMIERAAVLYRTGKVAGAGVLIAKSLLQYPMRNRSFFRMLLRSLRRLIT